MSTPRLLGYRRDGSPIPEIAGGTNVFACTARAYQWFWDGSEAGALPAQNENAALQLFCQTDADVVLRYSVQESGAGSISGATTDDYQLQRSLNAGAFTNVTGASSVVIGWASGELTDAGTTTQRLSSGTGSFVSGEISEVGLVTDRQLTANNFMELVYTVRVLSAGVANADALTFRVLLNGAVFAAYTVTPTINVIKGTSTFPAEVSMARTIAI